MSGMSHLLKRRPSTLFWSGEKQVDVSPKFWSAPDVRYEQHVRTLPAVRQKKREENTRNEMSSVARDNTCTVDEDDDVEEECASSSSGRRGQAVRLSLWCLRLTTPRNTTVSITRFVNVGGEFLFFLPSFIFENDEHEPATRPPDMQNLRRGYSDVRVIDCRHAFCWHCVRDHAQCPRCVDPCVVYASVHAWPQDRG